MLDAAMDEWMNAKDVYILDSTSYINVTFWAEIFLFVPKCRRIARLHLEFRVIFQKRFVRNLQLSLFKTYTNFRACGCVLSGTVA